MMYTPNYDIRISFQATKGQRDYLKRYAKLYNMTMTEAIQEILNQDYVKSQMLGFSQSALHRKRIQDMHDEYKTCDYDPAVHFAYLQKEGSGYVPDERPLSEEEFDDMVMWYDYFKKEAEEKGEEYDDTTDPRTDENILRRLDKPISEYYCY